MDTIEFIDNTISSIIELKEKKKKLEEAIKAKTKIIEAMYSLDKNQKEIIRGKYFYAEKIPSDKGKNDFDPNIVEAYLASLGENAPNWQIIKTEKKVDAQKFNMLCKDGFITETMLDSARLHKWTFSTSFKKNVETEIAEDAETANIQIRARA